MARLESKQGGDSDYLTDAIQHVVEGGIEAESLDGDVENKDIRIDAPKEPEVDPALYKDVESLIFRGFLTLYGEVNGVPFVFKSINHHEYENLSWLHGGANTPRGSVERFYNTFIAYGVFMVDGQNVLTDRAEWIPLLGETFGSLPAKARSKIIRYLGEVNRRASNAVILSEAYTMEVLSRFKWAQLKGLDLMSTACTGVPGTEGIGLNYAQLVWRAMNNFDDLREQAEREWDHAKFIGSCFAGKEIRKVYTQDQERKKKEKELRIERRDKLFRQVLLGEDPAGPDKSSRTVKIMARTVEELTSQLERDLRGEKDFHDQIVAREEERMKSAMRERQEKIKAMSEARDQQGFQPRSAHTEMAGLSRQEVEFRIQRRRQLEAQQAASRVVQPEVDQRMSDFMDKYVSPSDGTYQPRSTDRDPSEVRELPPPRSRATPFRR